MAENAKLDWALERVRSARADYEAKQDDVHQARERYYEAVRSLNSTGMSLREVADALGLSHQRVHQMIHEAEPVPSKVARGVRKASKAGGAATLVVLLAASVMWFIGNRGGGAVSTPTPTRIASLGGTSPTAPDAIDKTVGMRDRGCVYMTGGSLRDAARHSVTRVWFDRDGTRPVRGLNVDIHVVRPGGSWEC